MTIHPLINGIMWDFNFISLQEKYDQIIYELTLLTDLSKKDLEFIFPYKTIECELKELKYKNKDAYLEKLIARIFEYSKIQYRLVLNLNFSSENQEMLLKIQKVIG
ncbi:hypothetical protein ACTFIU_004885, partial [Dictyostelium citrinum]